MRKIVLLFLFIGAFWKMNAQNYYEIQWKKIETNAKQGLYKSNLPAVLEIQNHAVKDGNTVELIKSLKAEFTILNQTQDDTKNDAAYQFFAKLKGIEPQMKGEEKLVFKALLGEFISDYYQNNAWKINQRTNFSNQDLSAIETWTKLDFKNYLSKHFAELDSQKSALKIVKMEKYKPIFSNVENLEYFPTLFDWNASKQIDFLKNTQLFTPNERKENQQKINEIYSELIGSNSGNPKLYFEYQKINDNCQFLHCKDKIQQLENLYNSATAGDYKVLISDEIAQEFINEKKITEALLWIEKAKKDFPNSKFLNNIKNRENSIKNPSLIIHYETETQSGKPIHIVAEHKNVNSFSLKIYEVNDAQGFLKFVRNPYQNPFSSVKKTLVRTESFEINNPKDFKTYKTSLEIKPLPSGIYLVEYAVEGNSAQNFYFIASGNRVLDWQKNQSSKDDLQKLVSRENGKEIPNTAIDFYEYSDGKNIVKSTVNTDSNGIFSYPKSSKEDYYRSYLLKSGNNFQLVNQYGNERFYDGNDNAKQAAQIFLDRAIYRPGQTLYFKVINTKLSGEKETVNAGISQKISLFDANDQEISSQNFTTNEFGSYNGNFILPSGKLNGNFSLRIEDKAINAYKDFRVEEYKRPKFEVSFEPIKSEYKYGEIIELKGKAVMFSGVPLSNSAVNYEIKKQNIRWRYFWWYPRGNDNENSILGSVKTNEKGEFTIKIDLKKDETLDGVQVDNYQISASVTDINGETQSATENVKVASVSHYIKSDEIGNIFTDENAKVKVETKNYNDQNLQKSYHAKLSKLQEPTRIFRDNFKEEIQDLPKYSEGEFVQKFPQDRFSKEDLVENWKVEKTIFDRIESQESRIQTAKVSDLGSQILDLGYLEAGTYRLELYNIEGKDTIKTVQNFQVWDKKTLENSQKPFLEVVATKEEISRGEKAKIYVYSAIEQGDSPSLSERDGVRLNVFVQNGNGETQTETLKMKNGMLIYEIMAPKDEKVSRLNVQFQMVAFNDVQTKTVEIKIKDEKENLRIETVTFRDKLEPNVKEKWSVKILGNAREKVQAEVMANMYDKSLDQFAANSYGWQRLFQRPYFIVGYDVSQNLAQQYFSKREKYLQQFGVNVPQFSWFDGEIGFDKKIYGNYSALPMREISAAAAPMDAVAGKMEMVRNVVPEPKRMGKFESDYNENGEKVVVIGYAKTTVPNNKNAEPKIPIRQNLNETAFFYPNLLTDKDGNVAFEFTSPEALTQWKLMFLAHTKDARAAVLEKTVVTQKEFSVTPNYPRFLREGDELNLQSKLSNLTAQKLGGSATLQILDAFTNEDISEKFGLKNAANSFNLNENGNAVSNWKIKVPNGVSSIIFKVIAKASSPLNPLSKGDGTFSDGEQKAIPVLPNRMLVTDSQPIFVKEGQTKTFVLENLAKNNSTTATNVSNTLELTTNPIWEVMFALPSLKDDQNLSADVQFNKWFADVLASEIFKANPKLKTVFDEYQNKGLLTSNLEKNQELKQLLLEETPWVLESKNETEQMQKLARIFDANTMRNSINQDWEDLKKLQNADGGFSWVSGYPSSYQSSLYILKNLGKLNEWLKGNMADYQNSGQKEMLLKLVNYVDNEVNKYYSLTSAKENIWNNFVLDYLDTRHYWENKFPLKAKGLELKNLVIKTAPTAKITDFTFFGLHRAALLFDDYKLTSLSKKLLTYLKETSTDTETQGVYWKQNLNDWGWYSSKTVNHAGALEAFQKLAPNDINFIEDLKIWLITQKEVSNWDTSRSTAEVIFTILNSGKSWTSNDSDRVDVKWGASPQPSPKERGQNAQTPSPLERVGERPTGYIKQSVLGDKIDKNLATVTVKKDSPGIVQGGVFWQYYEDLDRIKSTETYLSITKELYRKVKTANGEELQPITTTTPLKVGDKVTVRMILDTDRNMEFIHLKDMRAAGFEPLDVLSGYQWKNNLGYYQSTKDASTNFYIERMPKGKYVFEYDLVCNASGSFSGGISTLQNYYAPQMNAHTKGMKIEISE